MEVVILLLNGGASSIFVKVECLQPTEMLDRLSGFANAWYITAVLPTGDVRREKIMTLSRRLIFWARSTPHVISKRKERQNQTVVLNGFVPIFCQKGRGAFPGCFLICPI